MRGDIRNAMLLATTAMLGCHILLGYDDLEPVEQSEPLPLACMSDAECVTDTSTGSAGAPAGHCVDGFCCDTPCTDRCASCGLATTEGICTAYQAGADPEGECDGDALNCVADACNGTKGAQACVSGDGQLCREASCGGEAETTQGICENGICSGSTVHDCIPYTCGATACLTSCSSLAQCAPGYICDNGTCQLCDSSDCQTVIEVSCGAYHTCALLSDATARCWGRNHYGQLGTDDTTNRTIPAPVLGLTNVVSLAVGGDYMGSGGHSCARLEDGTVTCWGRNQRGQLGVGFLSPYIAAPMQSVMSLDSVAALSLGGNHSCALRSDHTVQCWGRNVSGQLGAGYSSEDESMPVQVAGLSSALSISIGGDHGCALLMDSTAHCWGYNNAGQLGNGNMTDGYAPAMVSLISGLPAVAVGAGGSYVDDLVGAIAHSCAVVESDMPAEQTVQCWGSNDYGQLGDGSIVSSLVPVAVVGLTDVQSISNGFFHSCAVLADGTVRCWGRNDHGQLGNGSDLDSTTPVPVWGLYGVKSLSSGGLHSCAVVADGTVHCWGRNDYGQLGNGTVEDSQGAVQVAFTVD